MPIYLVIHEDRHVDVEVSPYRSRDEAILAAEEILTEHEGAAEDLTPAMTDDSWIFFGTYSSEEDCVRVVERQLI